MGVLVLATHALAACGGGGSGDMGQANAFCYAFGSGGPACTGCTQVTNSGNAFDGNLDTGASIGPGGQATFTGTGDSQPAGRGAGVYFFLSAPPSSVNVSVRTLASGVVQDSAGPSSTGSSTQNCAPTMDCLQRGTEAYIGIGTTRSFNAVQVTISNSSSGAIDVRELCLR